MPIFKNHCTKFEGSRAEKANGFLPSSQISAVLPAFLYSFLGKQKQTKPEASQLSLEVKFALRDYETVNHSDDKGHRF